MKYAKKLIVLLLTVSMIFSVFVPAMAVDTEYLKDESFSYSSADGHSQKWSDEKINASANLGTPSSVNDGELITAVTGDPGSYATVVKDNWWKQSGVKTFETDVEYTYSTSGQATIALYTDSSNNTGFGIRIYTWENKLYLNGYSYGNIDNDKSWRYGPAMVLNYGTATSDKLHFKVEYDYTTLTGDKPFIDVVLQLTSDKLSQPMVWDTYVSIVPKDGYTLKENFKAGIGSSNLADIMKADNVKFTFRLSEEERVAEYLEKYSYIAEKNSEELSNEDKAVLIEAVKAFDLMNENEQIALSSVYSKLYSLCKTEYSSEQISDNFDNAEYSNAIWKTETISSTTVLDDETTFENGVMKPAKIAKGSPAVITLMDAVSGAGLPKTVSFKLNLNNLIDSRTANSSIYAVYSNGENGVPSAGVGFGYFNYGGNFYLYQINNSSVGIKDYDVMGGGASKICAMPADKAVYVTLKYDWSNYVSSKAVKIEAEFTIDGTVYDKTAVYQFGDYEGDIVTVKQFAFGSLSGNADVTVDDFEISFLSNAFSEAKRFETEHSLLLKQSTYTNEELESFAAAYNAITPDSRKFLSDWGFLDKAKDFFGFTGDSATESFKTTHSTAINKDMLDITYTDTDGYANILAEYDGLTIAQKLVLNREYASLAARYLKAAACEIPRNEYDKAPIIYNFEDGKGFVNERVDIFGTNEIVIDPVNGGDNHVWYTEGLRNSMCLITDAQWPKYCQPTTVSFKLYLPDYVDPFSPFSYIVSYIDDDNYTSLVIDKDVCRYTKRIDGISQGNVLWQNVELDYTGWLQFNITYFADGTALVIVVDQNDTNANGKLNYNLGGKIGFCGLQGYDHMTKRAYVDDFRVDFTDGDFDVNNEPGKISVYYCGNTFIAPNESVTVSGEKLAKTVESAKIYKLDDDNSGLGYVLQENYNNPADINYDPDTVSEYTFDEGAAIALPILQMSDLSFNITIPKELSKGVYAVKLKNKVHGCEDRIIYINLPRITQIHGSEGKASVSGGFLRIIGNNLGVNTPTVKLKNKTTGNIITVTSENIEIQDDYSIKAQLPELDLGKYDVYVHNGYGNSTAYSTPYEVEVIKPIRDSWPATVYNVRAYGAVGNGYTNDTPAFLAALSAAAQNGGGTVYVPTGDYRLVAELAIPSNVRLIGDGSDRTVILWTARRWAINSLPAGNVNILGNAEISGIYFSGSRVASAIRIEPSTSEKNSNIYINDVKTHYSFAIGAASNAGGCLLGITQTEAYAQNLLETNQKVYYNFSNGKSYDEKGTNLQVTNCETEVFNRTSSSFFNCNYQTAAFNNFDLGNAGGMVSFEGNIIFENSNMSNVCVAPCGGLYFARNTVGPQYNNNRELMTTDGGPWAMKQSIQFVGDKPEICGAENVGDTTFKALGALPKVGYNIFVTNGQGIGQARIVTWVQGNLFKVDKPFEVNPNRNSEIGYGRYRIGMYFIENTWHSGAASGTYGAMVDAVFDGNRHIEHQGQIFDNHEGPVWYISNINCLYSQKTYVHGEVVGDFFTADYDKLYLIEYKLHGSETFGNIGIAFKNNYLDGYAFAMWSGTSINSAEGIIYEGNTITDVTDKSGINITAGQNIINNLLIRNNDMECDVAYSEATLGKLGITNKYGSNIMIIDDIVDDAPLGDVNLDGRITLKDVTLIKMHVMGQVDFSDAQLAAGDVNKDNTVDLKDANQIRKFILTGENYTRANSWFDGVW